MKSPNVSCEDHKPELKNGGVQKCACRYLNRKWFSQLKRYRKFMKEIDR